MANKKQPNNVEPDPQFPATPNPPSDLPDTAKTGTESADTQAGILTPQAKTAPTLQGDINSVLQPYINEMMQLGPEYAAEMEYLKPYLVGNESTNTPPPEAYTGPGASQVIADQNALAGAESAVGNTLESQAPPGFGNVAQAGKEYESTILPQQPEQAALAYQKYLQTYGGLQPQTAGWSQQAQEAYKAILGSGASGSGLPSPADSTAASQAANTINQITSASGQGGGNTS